MPLGRPTALEGPEWVVTEMGGEALLDRSRISLVFDAGQLSGTASCNRYVAEWARPTADRIRIGPARSTLRACAPALMDQERRFLELLGRFETVRFSDPGDLVLETAEGVILRASPS